MRIHTSSSEKRRRVFARSAATLGLALALGAGTVTAANADYYSGGMPSRTWTVKPVAINGTWIGYLDTGRTNWNASGAGTSIGRSSSAASTFTAGRYAASWFGLYSPSGIRGINRTFSIQVNARTLEASAGSNMTAWILSTTTHELGHGLSLADNPNTSSTSLMKHNRSRANVQKPRVYDVSEVKRIY